MDYHVYVLADAGIREFDVRFILKQNRQVEHLSWNPISRMKPLSAVEPLPF